jgi:histone-lysine N-methyltransferase SETMAR
MVFIELKIRAFLLYEFKFDTKATEAAARIRSKFGEDSVSDRVAQHWFRRFRDGDESLEDRERSGRPQAFDDATLRDCIESDPRQTCADVALELKCDESTARKRLHELGFTKKLDKWVPHILTGCNKFTRFQICTSLLSRFTEESFLDRIVTCDEKWVLYDNSRRSGSWSQKGSAPGTAPKSELHPKKVLMSVWWTARGIIHVDYFKPGSTITADVYCSEIEAVHQKLLESYTALVNRKGVLLLHDNARPHIALSTRQKLKEVGWEILPHPPYSPDISPSDYHLFLSMSNFLRNKRYSIDTELKTDIQSFFDSKDANFYHRGIFSLVERWQKVVDSNGDYFVE